MKTAYAEAFREQALAKAFRQGERTIESVAKELNMSVFTLKREYPALENSDDATVTGG